MKYSPTEKGDIIAQLGACLAVQRTYGKQAADIQVVAKIFIDDLKDFSANEVVEAISKWRKTSPEFPTPADIINLLNPKPTFDKSVYLSLIKRKGEVHRYSKEYDYIKAYEKNEVEKYALPQATIRNPSTTDKPKVAPITTPALDPIEVEALLAEFNAPKEDKPTFDITEEI